MQGRVGDTEQRRALREVVRRFTTERIVPHLDRWEQDGALPRSLHREAADAGLLQIGFPTSVGGAGGDLLDVLSACEELILAGGSSGVVAGLFTHGIALPHLVEAGDPALIDRFARPVLAGEMIAALGVTEPDAGSDVAGLTTRAVRDGDHYVVDGAKRFITSATRAEVVTTAVRTGGPGPGGISLLAIETDRPGVWVSEPLRKMGWWCSDTGELAFDGVRVPVANLIGQEHEGFAQIMAQFAPERLTMAVQSVATAQRCLDLTIDYVGQRETFGRPLASRQVIRHRLADLARRIEVARTFVWSVAERFVAGEQVWAQVAMAKNTAVEVGDAAVDEAVQLHGGMGYLRETEVERHYRDHRIMGIGGGTTEIMTELIARLVLPPASGVRP
ncbi:MAG: acyl-CoA dehydrogenase family protein [Nitriliruptoraceae bacterium]|nr:acyl-CoA dehydrogenase family protein [Nitriliruptoraceae bacterium]